MSQLQSVRVRSQRTAAAAVERARLTLVPHRPSNAPRAPFAVLVFVILGLGVVGLLVFNTHMQQASFAATKLQNRADALQAKSEMLQRRLDAKNNPQNLATAGRKLGMVTPPVPAMINLKNGRTYGVPTTATPADRTPLVQPVTPLPSSMKPKPIVKTVQGQTPPANNGPASTASGTAAGTNSTQTSNAPSGTGAPR